MKANVPEQEVHIVHAGPIVVNSKILQWVRNVQTFKGAETHKESTKVICAELTT